MQKIIDALDLTVQWLVKPPACRPEILRILRSAAARNDRHWHFYPVSTDRRFIIGQSTPEIERHARILGLVFLALPSSLIFGAAAIGIPGSHLMILSVALSLVSIWMMARIKVPRLNRAE